MSNNLTIEEIQAVIDKGGCLVSDDKEIHYGRLELTLDDAEQDVLYYEFSNLIGNLFLKDKKFGEGFYTVDFYEWREATPEEIEKYVPVEYIPKKETFTKSDLISFGTYLLSKEREEMVTSKPERGVSECAIVIRQVSDADFENWRIK